MRVSYDAYLGALLGLAIGDAWGAPYEGGPLERIMWYCIGSNAKGEKRWTDDTQMSLDLLESLLLENELNQDALAKRFAQSYHWSRGYGPSTAKLLRRIRRGQNWRKASESVRKGGSFGNGAAMRSPVLALVFHERQALIKAAQTNAQVTHLHPLGLEGAVIIALSAHALLYHHTQAELLESLQATIQTDLFCNQVKELRVSLQGKPLSPKALGQKWGNGMTAQSSCISALYIALIHLEQDFTALLDFCRQLGGDVDTISAMAASLWGIHRGALALPEANIEGKARLTRLAKQVYDTWPPTPIV